MPKTKKFWFDIRNTDIEFREPAIRLPVDTTRLALDCLSVINASVFSKREVADSTMLLATSRMNRVFICLNGSITSIGLPFQIQVHNDIGQRLYYRNRIVDSLTFSALRSIVFDCRVNEDYSKLYDSLIDIDNNYRGEIIDYSYLEELIHHVISFDYGYLRFDDDKEHENGNLHPRYHLDVGYVHSVHYKIGLKKSFSSEELMDVLNVHSECYYLEHM